MAETTTAALMPSMVASLSLEGPAGAGAEDGVAGVDVELVVGAAVVDGSCVLVDPSVPV